MSGADVVVGPNIFVTTRNSNERGFSPRRRILNHIDRDELLAVVSTVTVAELRAGFAPEEVSTVWKPLVARPLTSPNYSAEPVRVEFAEKAGDLRASTRLTLPDWIIVATGQSQGIVWLV